MSKKDECTSVWHEYVKAHSGEPGTPREIARWGVENGLLGVPKVDPYQQLAEDMARAMREEYRTDRSGRRYRANHAVTIVGTDGLQFALWADMKFATREHMQKAFAQRRQQIVGDCLQLKTDVDAYNEIRRTEPPIQTSWDFTNDMAEAQALEGRGPATSTSSTERPPRLSRSLRAARA